MKVAITSSGNDLMADIDPRFGRAENFILVDPETMEFTVVENTQNLNLPQGAGIQAAKTIVDHKAKVLITGNCGPKAFQILDKVGIKIIVGAKGRVVDALQQYKNNELQPTDNANVEGHWV
jgi:predicted Fe-Mo cluster-binding NifX family protein